MNAVRSSHTCALLAVTAVCGVLTACSTAIPPPVQKPPAELETPPTADGSNFEARWPVLRGHEVDPVEERRSRERLSVSKDLHDRCDLSAVYFDFDSADPSPEDRAEIARVARCFRDGPLRDRRLRLIGRADLTGDPDYNMALGLRRAHHVKRELVRAGVPASRILTTSRGTTAFLGPFEGYTYADDRRVDLVVTQ